MARHPSSHVSIPKVRKITLKHLTRHALAKAKRPVRGSTSRSMGNHTVRRRTTVR